MKLAQARALVTGASGGIGAAVVAEIVRNGGKVLITGRDEESLQRLARALDREGETIAVLAADVTRAGDRRKIVDAACRYGVNVLINNAGVASFGMFSDASGEDVEHAFAVNVLAPMHLCKDLLPHLRRQQRAHIVNIGSVFGAIGYPGHATYSATKFALRGFSEALRRELGNTNVRLHYLAPRATRTKFNCSAVEALNAKFGVAMDAPERVALAVRHMLEAEQADAVIGWPEKLFVRINAVLPGLVDRALAKQLPAIRQSMELSAPTPVSIQSTSRKAS
jgi:short-subunit dehydrogenase